MCRVTPAMNLNASSTGSLKRSSDTPDSPTDKRHKQHDSAQTNSSVLNATLNNLSDEGEWRIRMTKAEDDISRWQPFLSDVLVTVSGALALTTRKSDFIDALKFGSSHKIASNLSPEATERLKIGVKKGLDYGNWEDLVNHRVFRRPPSLPLTTLGIRIEQKEAVISAWNAQYHGDGYKILLRAVDEMYQMPVEKHYAKVVPVAQSSGTGKSRCVDNIATERILFPLCLREDIGPDYFAYPPADTQVRRHLLDAPSAADELKCKAYLKSFLAALFTKARLAAQDIFAEGQKLSYAVMAKAFYEFFGDSSQRSEFYNAVVTSHGHPADPWISFNELQQLLKQHCYDWLPSDKCPILISIDEIHVLFNLRSSDAGGPHTLYSRLKSVLSERVSAHLCVIFMSTATTIGQLTPAKQVAPSIRERNTERKLPIPFTELPFDVYIIADPLVPGRESLSSVGTLAFTAKFGRPLFYATYLSRMSRGEDPNEILPGIMLIVREKLLGRTWPPESPAVLDASTLSVLSARFLLDLSPTAVNARRYAEELVRSHLRMLYSVHDNLEIMVTGTSPEPLIAEAAAVIIHYTIDKAGTSFPFMDVWGLLQQFVDQGLVPQGTLGELIGRVLSILAMDSAIDAVKKPCELKYQTPVTVAAYYKALLTDEAWKTLRSSVPANRAELSEASAEITFEKAFAQAYFHFSHYAKANDTTPMSDKYAWANWLRGTAILLGQLNQELTDRVHFIYFSNRGKVGPKTMSVDLNQDKAGQSADPQVIAIQRAQKLGVFSAGKKLPYIAAVHCYALTEHQGITVGLPKRDLRNANYDRESPRYQIDIRGLASYRMLTESNRTAIRAMISGAKNYIFDKHARKYGLGLLHQMLPVLTGDDDATAWFGDLGNVDMRGFSA